MEDYSMKLKPASFRTFLLLGLALVGLFFSQANLFASSHSEAPGIGKIPRLDCTDVYAFRSPDRPDTVTLIANYIPLEEPNAGPNWYSFDENGVYDILVDNDQNADEDITFRFRFQTQVQNGDTFLSFLPGINSLNSGSYNLKQTFSLTRINKGGGSTVIGSGLVAPPPRVGPKTTGDYDGLAESGVYTFGDIKVFVGQRDDPFFADLAALFDGLTIRKLPGNKGGGKDGLGGFNVHALAIQVPITQLTKNGSAPTSVGDPAAVIGVWSYSYLPKTAVQGPKGPKYSGPLVQVSRLGAPLVNEVVIPLKDKEKWNSSKLKNDAQFLSYVTDPEPARLLNALYGISVPPTPRNDLVAIFLTGIDGLTKVPGVVPSEQLRLNVAVPVSTKPSRLGLLGGDNQGYPNGRRLADDVIDITVRAAAGGTPFTPDQNVSPNNQLGDGVDQNDKSFSSTFPYMAAPSNPLSHTHHRSEPGK